jgi:O-antigen ligase
MYWPRTESRSLIAFGLLLCWLLLLPWPLGANRDWIWLWFAAALGPIALLALTTVSLTEAWRRWPRALRWALLALAISVLIDLLRAAIGQVADPALGNACWALADVAAARLGAIQSTTVLLLSLLLVALVRTRARARWLLAVIFVTGIAEALLGIGVVLSVAGFSWFGHELGGTGFATGTFVNRNHYAGMLELAGACGFGLLAAGIRIRPAAESPIEWLRRVLQAVLGTRLLVRVGLAVIVVALVLTRSRMGNVGFFFGLTLAGLAAIIYWRPLPKLLIWLLLSIVAVDVLVLGAWVGVEKLAERVADTRLLATPSAEQQLAGVAVDVANPEPNEGERWAVAAAGLHLWYQRPWLGHGAGAFRTLFPSAKPASVTLFYDHAHNDYVELLVERGALGLLLWLAAVLTLLVLAVQVLRAPGDSLRRGLALASIAGGSALLLHAMVDFNMQIPANRFWFQAVILSGAIASGLPWAKRRSVPSAASGSA